MLLAASESAVTKKPRFLFTTRRSSSVSPFGSFQSPMSRLMLISCGIQWLAQAARYFSQAHLYLKGTSWFRSAFELMTFLSSTVTRRKALPTGASSCCFAALVGTTPVVGWIARRGMGGNCPSSSKLSMRLSSCGRHGQVHELLIGCRALGRGGVVDLAGGDVKVPFATCKRHPVAVFRVLLHESGGREILGVPEMHGMEHEQAPARNHHRVQSGRPRRQPQPRDEGACELPAAEGNHVLASSLIDMPRSPGGEWSTSSPRLRPRPEPHSAARSWWSAPPHGSRPWRAGSRSS